MPNDVLTLYALCRELKDNLVGGKIDKVTQPENTEIHLVVRRLKSNMRLLISVRPDMPRVHLTTIKKESPLKAPNFCMQLRKHLSGARINDVDIYQNDRIIRLHLTSRNEMMDDVTVYLLIELMGSRSNVLLLNKDNRIITALKITGIDNCNRSILPNTIYSPPTNDKISVFDKDKLDQINYSSIDELLKVVSGFSKTSANEAITYDKLSTFVDTIKHSPLMPNVVMDDCANPVDFTPIPYKTLSNSIQSPSLSEAMETYYKGRAQTSYLKEKSRSIKNITLNALKRTQKKMDINLASLKDSQKAELYKLYGELLTSYTYMLNNDVDSVEVTNYYTGEQISIPLDTTLSIQKNAQNYYKKYTKLKRTAENAESLVNENREMLDTLREILREIDNITDERDIEDIESELSLLKLMPISKKVHTTKKSKPLSYEVDGYTILVGKNAVQNNHLTFEVASALDTWVHILNYHGSHVIIRGENPPDNVIKIACEIAGYYSSSDSDKVSVDYTLVKHVKKNRGEKLGGVTYKYQKTLIITPNKREEYLTVR